MVAMVILYLPVCGVGDSFTMNLPPRPGGQRAVLGREGTGEWGGDWSHHAEEKEKGELDPEWLERRVSPSRC